MKIILIFLFICFSITVHAQKFKAATNNANSFKTTLIKSTLRGTILPTDTATIVITAKTSTKPGTIRVSKKTYTVLASTVEGGKTTYLCDNDAIIYYQIYKGKKMLVITTQFNSESEVFLEPELRNTRIR